jgi:glycerol-3-phosphate dehydrogenase (NAD(P)+)
MPDDASPQRLAVLGAGAWGTTLARLLAHNGHSVSLWTRERLHAEAMTQERINAQHLPGAQLPSNIFPSADLDLVCEHADALFLAVPVRATLPLLGRLRPRHHRSYAFVLAAKGFVDAQLTPLSRHLRERFPDARIAVLAGPNLASEVASGKPTAASVAADSDPGGSGEGFAAAVQMWLHQRSFRIYPSDDVIGVELGGAIKNVIALAAGMADALELGENAKATLITRGLAEMVRLGDAMGARAETLYGLSGLGDLIATCAGDASRNHRAGARLVAGERLVDLQNANLTAEGLYTVEHVVAFADRHALDLPLMRAVAEVVHRGSPPREALESLLTRPPRSS